MKFRLLIALAFAPACAFAGVSVDNAWARATAPNQPAAGAFMNLTADTDTVLVSASNDASGTTELHSMKMDNGVMVMRAVPQIDLPKGKTVALKPGGLHVMLIGLKRQLKEGETVTLQLKTRDASGKIETLTVKAPVKSGMPMSPGPHH
jgi:copper(I)-binding protein